MRTTLKKIFIAILTVATLCSSALPCFAATQNGKISITLEDKEKKQIDNMSVDICQIATLNNAGYFPVTTFENSGISIAAIVNNPDEYVAKTIVDYVKTNNIKTTSAVSKNGKVEFDKLDLGIWLVFPKENEKYTFNPYIVFLPLSSSGKLYYEVSSTPKLEDNAPNEINIYVIKKWEDKNNASKKRPDSVTIELLNGDKVVSSVMLSEENGWAHTFLKLEKGVQYKVREKSVANYKAEYSGDAVNGFVITNTYNGEKLPQTGQLWWPIVIIAIAGTCFVLLGVYEIGVKKNGKKK